MYDTNNNKETSLTSLNDREWSVHGTIPAHRSALRQFSIRTSTSIGLSNCIIAARPAEYVLMLLRRLCLLLFNKELESRWPTPHAHLIRPLGLPLLDALRCLLRPSLFFSELLVELSEQILVDRKTLVPLALALVSSLEKLSVLDCCGSAITTRETLIVAVCDLAEDILMQRHSLTVLVGGSVQL